MKKIKLIFAFLLFINLTNAQEIVSIKVDTLANSYNFNCELLFASLGWEISNVILKSSLNYDTLGVDILVLAPLWAPTNPEERDTIINIDKVDYSNLCYIKITTILDTNTNLLLGFDTNTILNYWYDTLNYITNNCYPLNIVNANNKTTTIIFPNPVQNYLNIDVQNNTINKAVVYNTLGVKVLEQWLYKGANKVNISSWANGLYIVQVQNAAGNVIENKKVIKE